MSLVPTVARHPRPAPCRTLVFRTRRWLGDGSVRSWELWAHGQLPASPVRLPGSGPDAGAARRALRGLGTRKGPSKSVPRAGHGAGSLGYTLSSPTPVPPLGPDNATWTDTDPKAQTRHVTSPKLRGVHGPRVPGRHDPQQHDGSRVPMSGQGDSLTSRYSSCRKETSVKLVSYLCSPHSFLGPNAFRCHACFYLVVRRFGV